MPDTFYKRLDFYRMLEAGRSDLAEIAAALGVSVRTLQRWKKAYDPGRSSFNPAGGRASPPERGSDAPTRCGNIRPARKGFREEIIAAVRQVALEGNVPAAKLLLSEYRYEPTDAEETLTVEKAVELLREWGEGTPQDKCND